MEKIVFENFPSTKTPIDATNLNLLQTNVENAITENTNAISEIEKKLVATVLYENETSPIGTGTIPLSDDISNYKKVDITFINTDNEVGGVSIYNPSNKKICLMSSHAGGTSYYVVNYFAYITLSGKIGTYSEGRTTAINNVKTIFSVDASSTQKITSIIGYK